MKKSEQQNLFSSWIHSNQGILFKIIRSYAFTDEDRDDLFQEISIQLWHSIPNYKGESALSTWIYRVSLYSAITWSKKEHKHHANQQSLTDVHYLLTEINETKDERLDWLYGQIAKLSEIDRSLTILLLDGYSYHEMADILGISESYIGVKINRIKKYFITVSTSEEKYGV